MNNLLLFTLDYDLAMRELFLLEVSVRRMTHMINSGYYCHTYSEEEWQKFKKQLDYGITGVAHEYQKVIRRNYERTNR